MKMDTRGDVNAWRWELELAERRKPVNNALHERLLLMKKIALNRKRIAAHAGDNAELEKVMDAFFDTGDDWQTRAYKPSHKKANRTDKPKTSQNRTAFFGVFQQTHKMLDFIG